MRDVQTLTFDGLDLDDGPAVPAGLPRFVPQVDQGSVGELDADLGWGAYAVGLRRVFSADSHSILPVWRTSAHSQLGIGTDPAAVLVGYGKDPLVEALWTRRFDVYPQLAEQRWDVVLAPNYSQYGNHPRAEMLLNYRRNLQIAVEMRGFDVCAVPNIYWFRLEDLDRVVDWAMETEPEALAVNLQTFRSDTNWEQFALPGLTYLAELVPGDVVWFMTGTSRLGRIATLADLFGDRLRLVSNNPLAFARHGAVMTAEGRVDLKAATADAFAANVRFYASLLETAAGGVG